MTRQDIQTVYEAGREAVIALVERLLGIIAQQEQALAALAAKVQELEDRLSKDSHNSSKPPASDGLSRKSRSLRGTSGKKPGGQPGHSGKSLQMVEVPDQVVTHSPAQCQACGTSLLPVEATKWERRQVFDLPPLELVVTEHQAQVKQCPCCGRTNRAAFPESVTQTVQYGEGVKALGVYLQGYHLLPYERTRELMEDLFGASPCPGTLYNAMQTCSEGLQDVEASIQAAIAAAPLAQFDETGVRIEGKLWWLHSASTARLTHYACHEKRGQAATKEIGILPAFNGRAVHDGWSSYFVYPCEHALCNAHHLRELTFIQEQAGQTWAQEMIDLLLEIKQEVDRARGQGDTRLSGVQEQAFATHYAEILAAGLAVNPLPAAQSEAGSAPKKRGRRKQSKARNLLDRLQTYQRETLAFMYDFDVPFDNNLAERDLRMMKVQQKISGCFRSEGGAQAFCRIRSYISTLRKQGQPVLAALRSVFTRQPVCSPLLS